MIDDNTIIEWLKKHLVIVAFAVMIAAMLGYQINRHIDYVRVFTADHAGFEQTIVNYAAVERILTTFIPRFNGSRIGVARFHNSVRDVANNSLFFLSYETIVVAPGVTSDLADLQRVPAVVIADVLPDLFAGRPSFVWTRELDHGTMKEILTKRGIKAIEFIPIFDLTDVLIGMVTVTWLAEVEVPKKSDRDQMSRDLTEIALRIGAFLSRP